MAAARIVVLDGESLTPHDVVDFSRDETLQLALSADAWERVDEARRTVEAILADGKVAYGINTGFGNFASVVLPHSKLHELQENLIRSHAAGVGEPLTWRRARMFLGLRINVLAKGHSGIRRVTIEKMLRAFNACCISAVPEKGTVGASGDLAPLSHLALGLMGEGEMWHPREQRFAPASEVLAAFGLEPITLEAKEGLALINGAQFITCLACEAYVRAHFLTLQASVIAATSMEALRGVTTAFDRRIGQARPHDGLVRVASHMRALLHSDEHPSAIYLSCPHNVQDAYSMRCIPQVHGATLDLLEFAGSLLETECNAGTDNPMVFGDEIISGGNFHGEYPAKAADYIAIAVSELAAISERRIERIMNKSLNGPSVISDTDPNAASADKYHLPAFLVEPALQGLCSGFMIAHCTAAALVSENKVLVHPASADSITTSAGQEDHVSMGGFAARKALTVVEHSEIVLAIELLCAVQALDYLLPLKATAAIQAVHATVRAAMPRFSKDEYMKPHLDRLTQVVQTQDLWLAATGAPAP